MSKLVGIPKGGLAAGGLVKMIEEAGELLQIAGKQMAFPTEDKHPDGTESMRQRLQEEIADLRAALYFVETKFELDREFMAARMLTKLRSLKKWDGQK